MNQQNFLRIIAYVEAILGFVLLSLEIRKITYLSTLQEINDQLNGLAEWFYMESCYKNLFLYSLLFFSGVSFWVNKKLYWGMTHISLTTLFFSSVTNFIFGNTLYVTERLFSGILCLLTSYLEIKIWRRQCLKNIGVSPRQEKFFILTSLLSICVWMYLFAKFKIN